MSRDFTETIDQYCYEVWGHTDWAFEDTLVNSEEGRKELLRGHTIEGGIVFFHEEEVEEDDYVFGEFNPSVSVRNYSGRGGHETWGTQR